MGGVGGEWVNVPDKLAKVWLFGDLEAAKLDWCVYLGNSSNMPCDQPLLPSSRAM